MNMYIFMYVVPRNMNMTYINMNMNMNRNWTDDGCRNAFTGVSFLGSDAQP